MPGLQIDISWLYAFLERPDIYLVKALPWLGGFLFVGVLIYGFFEVWLFKRQHHYRHTRKHVFLAVDVPKLTEQSPKAVETLFAAIAAAWSGANFREKWIDGEVTPVFSFELVSDGGYIQYYVRCENRFRDLVEAAIYAHYPDAEISEAEDYAAAWPNDYPDEKYNAWGTEQKLKKPYYLPIKTFEEFEHRLSQELKDPLGLLLEEFSRLRPGEVLATQFLLMPLGPMQGTWIEPGVKYIYEEIGKEMKPKHKNKLVAGLMESLSALPGEVGAQILGPGGEEHGVEREDPWKFLRSTPIDKARLELVTKKLSKPAMHVKIRHCYVATHEAWNKRSRDKMIQAIFNQYSNPDSNQFKRVSRVTPKDDYFWQLWYIDKKRRNVVRAFKRRDEEIGGHPFILNIEELATLWHFPSILVKAPFVKKTVAKRAEPPVQLPLEEVGAPEMFGIGAAKIRPVAVPVEIVEPKVPTATAHHVVSERHGPPAKAIPDAVRVLFEPDVEPDDKNV